MNRVDRLFGILTLLQSRKYTSAQHLADVFEISIRSVYRDIKAMNEQGIPVSFEPGKGYFIVEGYFLPPVSFTTEEANALILLEPLLLGIADKSIQEKYSSALIKIKNVLKGAQKEKAQLMTDTIRSQVHPRMQQDYAFLGPIQHAITQRQILGITYKNQKEEESTRDIEPIGLIFYAFSWHVIGWCHLRREYRDFRVSRIQSVNPTHIPFTLTNHMSINEFMKDLPVDY